MNDRRIASNQQIQILQHRRRVELVDEGLPAIPHHVEAQALPLAEAIALIEQVQASANRHAREALAALAADLAVRCLEADLAPAAVPREVLARLSADADWSAIRDRAARNGVLNKVNARWHDDTALCESGMQTWNLTCCGMTPSFFNVRKTK